MKNIFTTFLFLMSFSGFAQEAGRAGELLKNEARTNEMQTKRNDGVIRGNDKVLDNSNYRTPTQSNIPKGNTNNNYRWNYNYGNSEVFVRIPQNGNYTVEVGDQFISNPTGKFRFFDLKFGTVPIAIYENNYLIYRTNLRLKSYTRLVLDFFPNQGLYLLGTSPVQNSTYGINEWDDIWNNPYGNQTGNWNGNSGNAGYYPNVMSSQEFSSFMNALKKKGSFDKDRLAMISTVSRNTNFTAQQIYNMVNYMDFDSNKLEAAKMLYAKCADQRNYHLVMEAFDFDSSRNKLMDYISRYR